MSNASFHRRAGASATLALLLHLGACSGDLEGPPEGGSVGVCEPECTTGEVCTAGRCQPGGAAGGSGGAAGAGTSGSAGTPGGSTGLGGVGGAAAGTQGTTAGVGGAGASGVGGATAGVAGVAGAGDGGAGGESAAGQAGQGGAGGQGGGSGGLGGSGGAAAGGMGGTSGAEVGGKSGSAGAGAGGGGGSNVGGAGGKGGTSGAGAGGKSGSAGTGAGGGAGAAAGAGGKGGSGGGTSCTVAPVTPNPSQQARNLLCYLYSQYGNHVLSGQQETSWSNPAQDISWYTSNGMDAPAILGGDYLYDTSTTTRAIAYWNAGGIPMIRYHMGAPPLADSYENSMGSTNMGNLLTPGTAQYNSLISKLDYAAAELQRLEDANAAVLWAPYHEVQPNGWFWWSKGTAAQFLALWKFTFDYLTRTKGLTNLVWLFPFSGSPSASVYPGAAYADLAGPDTYSTAQPFSQMFTATKNIVGNTIPIPLHETGLIPNPASMFPSAAPWVLFNIWASYQKDGTHNTTSNIQSVYAHSLTVTRGEVPNLR
jgi:hypothetical protein